MVSWYIDKNYLYEYFFPMIIYCVNFSRIQVMKSIVFLIIVLMAASNLDAVFAMDPNQEDSRKAAFKAITNKVTDDAIQLGNIIAARVEQESRYVQQARGHHNVPAVMRTGVDDPVKAVSAKAEICLTLQLTVEALKISEENLHRDLSTADKAIVDTFL